MTGGHLVPLLAVLATVVLLNLAITWALVRWDRDPAELLGSARYAPENATPDPGPREKERDPDGEPEAGDRPGAVESNSTRPPSEEGGVTLRTSAGTEFRLSGSASETEASPPPLDADGETVACRHCGAENCPEYRYCRWCVRSGFASDDSSTAAGASMTERSL